MFDARLRLMGDDGSKGAVLPTLEWLVTQVDSGSPTLTFTVSERVVGRLDAPQVVAVEYTTGAAFYKQPRGGLFIVDQDDSNDADPSGTVRFSGQDYMTWLMARTYLHWSEYAVNGERKWTETGHPASAGTIVGGMIWESQNRGWGIINGAQRIQTDFTWDKDSNGEAWTADEKVLQSWRLLTPLSQILRMVTEQGLADWWTEGMKLRMFRPGVGQTLENLVLGGPAFTARPVKSSFADVITNLTIVPEKAPNWEYAVNAGATNRFGRLEGTVTLSGVEDAATALTLAQPILEGGRSVKREYNFDWLPAVAGPLPWEHFNIGDVVTAKTRHGKSLQRVVGLQLGKKGDTLTARAIVGQKLLSQAAKQARRTAASTIPGVVGGGGSAFPLPGATFGAPLPPTGLRVESNVGSWREDGSAQADVKLAWNAVSQTVDGSGVDVAAYEVAVRTPESEPQIFATVTGLTASASEWEPGKERLARVRARDHRGQVSAWSDEISVTPQVPASIVPKAPTGLREVSNVAAFQKDGRAVATVTFAWDAVALSIEDVLVDIAEYEVIHGLSTQRVPGLLGSITIPSDADAEVRVRVRTTLGVWSDPSEPLTLKGALPAVDLAAPTLAMVGGMGGVVAAWDGLLGGAAVPAGFARVVLELGASATGPWTAQGIPWDAAGSQSVAAPIGEKRWARARAFDTLGRAGAYSAVVEATALGIAVSDVPGLEGDLDEIRYTADGKNRIYVSVTEPVRDRGRNYFNDPSFSAPSGYSPWVKATHAQPLFNRGIRKTGTGTQNGTYYPSTDFDVVPGEKFNFEMVLVAWSGPTPAGQASVYVQQLKDGAWTYLTRAVIGTTPTANTEHVYTGTVTVPEGVSKFRLGFYTELNMPATQSVLLAALNIELVRSGDLWFQLDPTGASVVSVKVWNGTAWAPQVLYAENVIATGSIVGTLIKAGTIQADNLHPSVGDSINLFANSAINMLVGRANDADSHLGTLDGQVQDAQASADDAHAAASDAAGAAANVGTRLDQHQTYYRFGPTGLAIGDPAAAAELRLSPTAIEMRQNSVVVSRWEGGVFVADEVRLKSASVANHKWEAYGPGRSILRPL